MRQFGAYIMRTTGVGTRKSVHNYADAMDLLGLIQYDRQLGRPGQGDANCITVLDDKTTHQAITPTPVAVA